jgi:hypothetical protein
MASALTFELRRTDGTPADPPTLTTVTSLWRPGDTIPLGRRTLRVVEVPDGNATSTRCWSLKTCPDERLAQLATAA